eukprot:Opistho-2@27385
MAGVIATTVANLSVRQKQLLIFSLAIVCAGLFVLDQRIFSAASSGGGSQSDGSSISQGSSGVGNGDGAWTGSSDETLRDVPVDDQLEGGDDAPQEQEGEEEDTGDETLDEAEDDETIDEEAGVTDESNGDGGTSDQTDDETTVNEEVDVAEEEQPSSSDGDTGDETTSGADNDAPVGVDDGKAKEGTAQPSVESKGDAAIGPISASTSAAAVAVPPPATPTSASPPKATTPTIAPQKTNVIANANGAGNTAATPARFKYVTIGKKRMWVVGWNAREFPAGALFLSPPPVLRWNENAVTRFTNRWEEVQAIKASDGHPGGRCNPELLRLIRAFPWGLMSSVRDIGTNLIESVMAGIPSRIWPEALQHSMRPFCTANGPDGDTSAGCFWTERFTQCTVDQGAPAIGLAFHQYITHAAPPYWDDMVAKGDVWWETADGKRIEQLDPPAFSNGREGAVEWSVYSMLRSMLFKTVWLANYDVRESIKKLEAGLALKKPMLVLQIRRTDKAIDHGIVDFRHRFPGGYVPFSAYGDMIKALEGNVGVAFKSVLLLTDDLASWRQRDEWMAGFSDRSVVPLINPYWLKYEALFSSPEWLSTGHVNLDRMADPSITTFHRELVADMMYASAHADYIVGCGSSGVSQYVAQGMGYRLGVDGTWVSLFEEDYFQAGV